MNEEIIIKEVKVKDIITKTNIPTGEYCANPYIGCTHGCRYCYACFMKRFTKHDEQWGHFIDVKYWNKIGNPRYYNGKRITIGSVTDPYNSYEKEYERTKELLNELKGSGAEICIITKSDLVLRDLDLIKSFGNATVAWSINTLDENFKSDMDYAPSIERRLYAMKRFYEEGIRTACFISPIFPGITKSQDIVDKVINQCDFIWFENLNLRGGYKSDIMSYIHLEYTSLSDLYDKIYNKHDRRYFDAIGEGLKTYCEENGYPYSDNYLPSGRMEHGKPMFVNYLYHEEVRGTNNSGERN